MSLIVALFIVIPHLLPCILYAGPSAKSCSALPPVLKASGKITFTSHFHYTVLPFPFARQIYHFGKTYSSVKVGIFRNFQLIFPAAGLMVHICARLERPEHHAHICFRLFCIFNVAFFLLIRQIIQIQLTFLLLICYDFHR